MSRGSADLMAPALLYTVAQTVLNEQGNAVISAWSEAELNSPKLDKTAAEHALKNVEAVAQPSTAKGSQYCANDLTVVTCTHLY